VQYCFTSAVSAAPAIGAAAWATAGASGLGWRRLLSFDSRPRAFGAQPLAQDGRRQCLGARDNRDHEQ
jgi:hypothetical protein